MAKVKDIRKWLDQKTGLTFEEREQWRNDVHALIAKRDPRGLKYFNHMMSWKEDKKLGLI